MDSASPDGRRTKRVWFRDEIEVSLPPADWREPSTSVDIPGCDWDVHLMEDARHPDHIRKTRMLQVGFTLQRAWMTFEDLIKEDKECARELLPSFKMAYGSRWPEVDLDAPASGVRRGEDVLSTAVTSSQSV
mmetsp:Transcript_28157/g.62094  ORF Transcript_28157/g.62094 Transcript_28157/m.62094 type:complete len:132 (-) Transcript_28157:47-442(-)